MDASETAYCAAMFVNILAGVALPFAFGFGSPARVWHHCVPLTYSYFAARPGEPAACLDNSTGGLSSEIAPPELELLGGPGVCMSFALIAFFVAQLAGTTFAFVNYKKGRCTRESFEKGVLKSRVNPWRWLAFAASSSALLLVVLAVCGVTDLPAVVSGLACHAAACAGGLANEAGAAARRARAKREVNWIKTVNTPAPNPVMQREAASAQQWAATLPRPPEPRAPSRLPVALLCAMGLVPWVGILHSYARSVTHARPVWFVHALTFSLLASLLGVALVEWYWTGGAGPARGTDFKDKERVHAALGALTTLVFTPMLAVAAVAP